MAGADEPIREIIPISEAKKDNPSAQVELGYLRLVDGSSEFHFSTSIEEDGSFVRFGGIEYIHWLFTITDLGSTDGGFPKPQLRVSDVDGSLSRWISSDDLILGSRFEYILTYAAFLDGHAKGSTEFNQPLPHYPKQVFYVSKVDFPAPGTEIVISLATNIDQQRKTLPGRPLGPYCTHSYRRWNFDPTDPLGGRWIQKGTDINGYTPEHPKFNPLRLSDVTCPYVGEREFDVNDNELFGEDRRLGRCGRRPRSDIRRFAEQGQSLATLGFLNLDDGI